MKRWCNSLLARTLARVLPIALLGLAVILALSHSATNKTLQETARKTLQRDGRLFAKSIENRIANLRDAVGALAGDNLIVNAVVEIEDRNRYLPVFIQSLRLPGVAKTSVTLFDYRGRPIDYGGPAAIPKGPAFEQAMTGRTSITTSDGGWVVAAPVRVEGMVEGVLAFQLSLSDIESLLRVHGDDTNLVIIDENGRVMVDFDSELFQHGQRVASQLPDQWFTARLPISVTPPLELLVAKNVNRDHSHLQNLEVTNFIGFAFVLVLLIAGIFATALAATRPLSLLSNKLRTIGKAEDLKKRIEPEGALEFRELAVAFNDMTERLEQTTTSRDRITDILNSLKELLLVTNAQGIIESANPAALAAIGCSLDELLGRQITEIFVPQDGDDGGSYLIVREAAKTEITFEAQCVRHSGEKFPVMMSAAAIRNHVSNSQAVIYTALDISAIKEAEEAVVRLEDRLSTAIESISDGFALYDQENDLVLYNSKFPALLPHSADAIRLGASYTSIHQSGTGQNRDPDADGPEDAFLSNLRLLQTSPEASQELQLRNGKWLDVMERRTADGGIVCLYRDITERKQREERLRLKTAALAKANDELQQEINRRKTAEASLRESESRTKALFEAAPDGIITIDEEGTIRGVNPATGQMFGCSLQSLVDTSVRGLVPELYDLSVSAAKADGPGQTSPGDRGKIHEMTAVQSDGSSLTVDVTMSRTAVGDGALFLAILRDTSERHKLEHLRHDLIATVSHELRTPMTSIFGALELLEAGVVGKLPSKAADMVSIACRACERMVQLLDDILDLEKVSAGKVELTFDRVPLRDLHKEIRLSMEPLARRNDVELEVRDLSDDVSVKCDWNRTIQILVNLVSNAIKFSPADGIVSIEAGRNADFVRFMVRDQGEGVPPEFASRIFEPFNRAENADRSANGGTGLGLAISRSLVQAQGGTIGYTSEPCYGSCFYFELPICSELRQCEPDKEARSITG